MKYCVNFYKQFRYNDIVDEIIYKYDEFGDELPKKIADMNWAQKQRIIIDICDIDEKENILPIILMCFKKHPYSAVRLDLKQEIIADKLREGQFPFFYSEHFCTMDGIYGAVVRGVTDVYVTESLGFRIKDVYEFCYKNKIKVRVIPNIAQYKPGFKNEIPDEFKFFIRPEDVKIYEEYVDIMEFIAPEDRMSILFEIYKNGRWLGDLKELIVGLNEPLSNTALVPYFGESRINCGQRCLFDKCRLCNRMYIMATEFDKNNLEIKKPKDEEWIKETKAYKEAMQITEGSYIENK